MTTGRRHVLLLLFAALTGAAPSSSAAQDKEDLAVLTRWPRYQDRQHAVYNYLVDQASDRLDKPGPS